jgi:uncharacterized protein UPF0182
VSPARRRPTLLLGAALLVALLVGGRWLALETAERAWAATIPGGTAYLMTRDFARLVTGVFLLAAVAWATGNLLFVYRAIGSVQLPRRLGDLEIVEAVPQRLLLAGTLGSGLVYGLLLALGTGRAWTAAAIAFHAPAFGRADPVLHRDAGYYLAQLPWDERLRSFALVATLSATVIVALLYLGIGSLRFRRWLPFASAHARAHLGVLLASLGLTLTWGALLDPAQTVAGLHGALTRGVLAVRLPAAPLVAALGIAATLASLVWVARERVALLVGSWGALLSTSFAAYLVLPAMLTGPAGRGPAASSDAFAAERRRLEGSAFGIDSLGERAPPGFPSPAAAVTATPLWDATQVMAAAAHRRDLLGPRAAPAAAALSPHPPLPPPGGGRPTWIVAPMPDLDSLARVQPVPEWREVHRGAWARAGRPVAAAEGDTGLDFAPLLTRDSATWFGRGFREFAVAAPDSWPRVRGAGLSLVGSWRRTALAWSLQSAELNRTETDGLVLLWHRDVSERLGRLAPFASFDDATPVLADGTLWWIAYGYLVSETFPLARSIEWGGRDVRYLRAAFIGAVSAGSGDTRLFLAPGADSLAAAWARLLAPLIQPSDSLPPALRAQLSYPRRTFTIATALLARWRGDSTAWVAVPRDPFELVATQSDGAGRWDTASAAIWTAQGFEGGNPAALVALVAGAMSAAGPRLVEWRPSPAVRLPSVLVGSPNETAPGVMRLWNLAGAPFSAQALFAQPATGGAPQHVDTLFLTWGERTGQGPTVTAALRDLLAAGGARVPADTSLAGRWDAARALAAQADAALAAGDLEAFGRYYARLKALLGVGHRKLAPAREPR